MKPDWKDAPAPMPDFVPYFLRSTAAHRYSGLGRPLFDEHIRPRLEAFRVGKNGIGYRRADVEEAVEAYLAENIIKEEAWQGNSQGSTGTPRPVKAALTSGCQESAAFIAVLEQHLGPKPKPSIAESSPPRRSRKEAPNPRSGRQP